MEMMKGSSGAKLLIAFVALLVGVVLLGEVAATTTDVTALTTKTETVDISGARLNGGTINASKVLYLTGVGHDNWRSYDYSSQCIPSTIIFKNQSGSTMTLTTHYAYTASTGALTLVNVNNLNDSASNSTTATYDYCPDEYLPTGFNSTTTKLIGGIFALALLCTSVGLAISVLRDEGII